ncbi:MULTISPECIES: FAD-dependent oxidoreductase [Halomonadaceae]|jgi:fumarate reductase flavoprotein subunit|uniref:FAD-dependent oxidoreductase n=1 Tax=Billgrantia aerodenitrificans TaxID=2733483 RepID=A0ABS9AUI9_9GAMM|nr:MULTISPECIES: FAD-dependent oxidoreductase [Halomonas]MCE8025308.1 FAD-dependent oxidoreductase [Halomonas aerodenitrificans]MCE8037468.1 FAD-dependent oxidoreductase [Halomonas sp. MCCC 1A11062]
MPIVAFGSGEEFEAHVPLVIVGAGACGLVAALAAKQFGMEAVVLERDALPRGSTSMSQGFIPAAGTRFQERRGVTDSPALMAEDIQRKNGHQADPAIVRALTEASAGVVEWLADDHGVPFDLVEGFLYPGHSRMRMHATPRRTGEELMGSLLNAVEAAGVDLLTEARVVDLHVDDGGRVHGVTLERPDGSREAIGCDALILACNGYGGNPELVARHLPALKDALYFGHEGNQGDALLWGEAMGASLKDLGACQGHGSLAMPHQTLITWAVMMRGGVQLNREGRRFSNEHGGYSEQAAKVLAQPGGMAWNLFDRRIHQAALEFEDYRNAHIAGAVRTFDSLEAMAAGLELPLEALRETFAEMQALAESGAADAFGRTFSSEDLLTAPYHAIKVTGALFHTQGGLEVNTQARVLRQDGSLFANLFAAGGAARGVSGSGDSGYLSGNGLLSAVVLGAIAGREAARQLSCDSAA